MIDKLINEGKYLEALNLLKNETDSESLYKRATCMYYLEQYEELIGFCDLYLEEMNNHYYDLLLIEVDCLIKLNDIDKAISLLEEELKMPYIPLEYEEKIQECYTSIIRMKKFKNAKESPYNSLTDEELFDLLDKSSNKTNDQNFDISKAVNLLNVLSKRNIRNFINEISLFLKDEHKITDLKVIMLEILKEQCVDHVFEYVSNNEITFLNSKDAPSLFSSCDLDKIINIILDVFNLKDMSILDYIRRLLVSYLVLIYPVKVKEEEYNYIAGALYIVAHNDNKIPVDLNEVSEKLNLNGNKFHHYLNKMMEVEIY